MGTEDLAAFPAQLDVWSRRTEVARRREMGAVIGEDRVDLVGQERVLAKSHGDGFLLFAQGRGSPLLGPHGSILDKGAPPPLLDGLWVDAVALGELQEALLTMLDRPTHRRRRAGAIV
jgi:hypothetical protein